MELVEKSHPSTTLGHVMAYAGVPLGHIVNKTILLTHNPGTLALHPLHKSYKPITINLYEDSRKTKSCF